MSKRKYSTQQLLKRTFTATFRAVGDDVPGVIEGTPIVFNQDTLLEDWSGKYYERIDQNALNNANLDDVRLFINHNFDMITLARSKRGNENSTMTFNIDETGFHFRATLDIENNAEARALYSAIKRGDMDGMSFAFRIKDYEWMGLDTDIPTLIIREISIVHEVSVVNFPAYPQTEVYARSKNEETSTSLLEEAKKEYNRKKEIEILKLRNENLIKLGGK